MPEKMMRPEIAVTYEPPIFQKVLLMITYFIITLVFLFYSPTGSATEYYVNDASTNLDEWCTGIGNDANNGLSPSTPKANVKAIIDTYDLEPGDVVHIDTGNYTLTSNIEITGSDQGSESAPVTFEASPYGVTLDRNSNPNDSSSSAFSLNNCDYVTIRTASSVKYSNAQYFMKITGGYSGIYLMQSENNTVNRVELANNSGYGLLAFSGANLTCSNNIIHNNGISGIGLLESLGYSLIKNNTIVKNGNKEGVLHYQLYLHNPYNTLVKDNIIWADGSDSTGIFFSHVSNKYFEYSDYNLFYTTNGASVVTDYIYEHSFEPYTLLEWQWKTGKDYHSIYADPMFVDPDNGDYHLKSTGGSYHSGMWSADAASSKGIDTGDPVESYSNESSKNGARLNLGAYGNTNQASKSPLARELILPLLNRKVLPGSIDIKWFFTGQGWQPGDTIKIEYSIDSGSKWVSITASVPVENGSYSWNTTLFPESHNYKLKISYNGNPGISAESEEIYSVHNIPVDYYVNDASTVLDEWCTSAGDDANDGISPATPKASVQSILDSYELAQGDVVHIDTGTYSLASDIQITKSDQGSDVAPVTFEASPYGVTINSDSTYVVFYLHDSDYITISTASSDKYTGVTQFFLKISNGAYGIYLYKVKQCKLNRLEVTSNSQYGVGALYATNVIYSNNLIHNNGDSGFYLSGFSDNSTLVNNTVVNNKNGQIMLESSLNIFLRNNIIWADGYENYAVDIYLATVYSDHNLFHTTNEAYLGQYGYSIYFDQTFSTLEDWKTELGLDLNSISIDPEFVDAGIGDYHLKSTGGSYHNGMWSADSSNSPGIDAGDPLDEYSNEPEINGGRINIGAYGGTEQASKSPTGRNLYILPRFLNDGQVIQRKIDIRWFAIGQDWQSGDTLKLEYSSDNGNTWNLVSNSILALDGNYLLDTTSIPNGSHCRIRITFNDDNSVSENTGLFYVHNGSIHYYVNDTSTDLDEWCTAIGNNTNNGLTPATPKATVQAILDAYDLEQGDVLHIDTGNYTLTSNIEITEHDQGTEIASVIFEASPYGVTFDRNSTTNGSYIFYLKSSSYVSIRTASSNKYPDEPQSFMKLIKGYYGIYLYNADNCEIEKLEISNANIGIYGSSSAGVTYSNNLIHTNADEGIYLSGSDDNIIVNNSIIKNNDDQIYLQYSDNAILKNNILWADGAGDYGLYCSSSNALEYSDFNLIYVTNGANAGYYSGIRANLSDWKTTTGMDINSISFNPSFVDEGNKDYHLKSTGGSYHDGDWIADAENSPGIDSGNPSDDFSSEPTWNGLRINMGAYGGTEQASKTIPGDIDEDGLPDDIEYSGCTNLYDSDTDDDGILDGIEDSNHDGIINIGETDPCDADTDNDGLNDGQEDINHNGRVDIGETNPLNSDTDNDGMPDGWEVQYDLDPLFNDANEDDDGDGYSNLKEYKRKTIPNDFNSHPSRSMPWLPLLLEE